MRVLKNEILKRPRLAEILRRARNSWQNFREDSTIDRYVQERTEESGQLILICGTGHCGTKWLAEILHRPEEGVIFYHEKRQRIANVSGRKAFAIVTSDSSSYLSHISRRRRQFRTVGDSNSWFPLDLLAYPFCLSAPPCKVIYLVRNGVPTVDSLYRNNLSAAQQGELDMGRIKRAWEVMNWPGRRDWENYSIWERWCIWWRLNGTGPQLLREEGYGVQVVKLEELSAGVSQAEEILGLKVNLDRYTKDINRKIPGSRKPEDVFSMWSSEQQSQFEVLCSSVMRQYEY